MKRRLLLGFGVLIACGCSQGDPLFPLRMGNEWSYSVKTGLAEYVESIKVSKELPVGGRQGYELTSSMGMTRLAWVDGVLLATALTGTRFNPPIPVLTSSEDTATLKWKGRMYSGGHTYEADATVTQSPDALHRDGRRLAAIKTATLIRLSDREIEIQSWYVTGTGLVNQVQRTRMQGQESGRFDLEMDYLSGP